MDLDPAVYTTCARWTLVWGPMQPRRRKRRMAVAKRAGRRWMPSTLPFMNTSAAPLSMSTNPISTSPDLIFLTSTLLGGRACPALGNR